MFIWFTRELDYKVLTALMVLKISAKSFPCWCLDLGSVISSKNKIEWYYKIQPSTVLYITLNHLKLYHWHYHCYFICHFYKPFILVRRCFIVLQHNLSSLALNIRLNQSVFQRANNKPLVSQSASRFLLQWVNDSVSGSVCHASDNDSATKLLRQSLYSNRATTENKRIHTPPPPLHSKLGCLLFSISSSNSGTTLHGGDRGGKALLIPLLEVSKASESPFRAKCLD